MGRQFLLEITTPERLFVMEMADMVILPTVDGENGVLYGHEKMVTALVSGPLHIQSGDTWRLCACSEGYATVFGDEVVVLAQAVEWPEEIDRSRAEAALARAQARLATQQTHRDQVLTEMALKRAQARLRVLETQPRK